MESKKGELDVDNDTRRKITSKGGRKVVYFSVQLQKEIESVGHPLQPTFNHRLTD